MRSEESPLDLNNLPEEYGKQVVEESSTTIAASSETSRFKKKKNGGKDESGKVYECRFCSLKFCKSQALGGHMNRHRQERETETLNRARQLVYSNEGLAAGVHLGTCMETPFEEWCKSATNCLLNTRASMILTSLDPGEYSIMVASSFSHMLNPANSKARLNSGKHPMQPNNPSGSTPTNSNLAKPLLFII